MTTPIKLTAAQKRAVGWLKVQGGSAVFDKKRVAVHFDQRAPVMFQTWERLFDAGVVRLSPKRVMLTRRGAALEVFEPFRLDPIFCGAPHNEVGRRILSDEEEDEL